jgi:hypothetical protein
MPRRWSCWARPAVARAPCCGGWSWTWPCAALAAMPRRAFSSPSAATGRRGPGAIRHRRETGRQRSGRNGPSRAGRHCPYRPAAALFTRFVRQALRREIEAGHPRWATQGGYGPRYSGSWTSLLQTSFPVFRSTAGPVTGATTPSRRSPGTCRSSYAAWEPPRGPPRARVPRARGLPSQTAGSLAWGARNTTRTRPHRPPRAPSTGRPKVGIGLPGRAPAGGRGHAPA